MITTEFYYEEMNTPIGPLLIVGQEECVFRIDFGTMTELKDKHENWFRKHFKHPVFAKRPEVYEQVRIQLDEYFANKRTEFSFNLKLYGTPFQQNVWKTLSETTPYGQTKTYQELAIAINNPKAVRAIGGAMNRNPISIVVPCHRIVGKSGKLVGYGGGIEKKKFLLELEK